MKDDNTKSVHTFTYQGEHIALLSDGRFYIGPPDEGEYKTAYDSLKQAQDALKRRIKTRERTQREKLKIPVYVKLEHRARYGRSPLPDELVERTLVGVHAGVGTLLLDPPVDKDDTSTVYVKHEQVKTLLAQEKELEDKLESVRDKLRGLTLANRHSYHSRIDETRHAQIIREIKQKCGVA